MDILTDIFSSAGLQGMLLTKQSFHEPWKMKFPCDKSMGFHLVAEGNVTIHAKLFKKPLQLNKGDIVMLKRGLSHEISTSLATLVCGLYQFKTEPIHPLFKEIPDFLLVKDKEILPSHPLSVARELLLAELTHNRVGTDAITKNLLDIIFNYVFRDWVSSSSNKDNSWAQVLKDKQISRAIYSIHEDVRADWTLDKLAKVASLSRASFAAKFKKLTGDTPAHYIRRIRIQKVMDMLQSESSEGLESIADRVGYSDSFVLSKAFKRLLGVSPKDYRKTFI